MIDLTKQLIYRKLTWETFDMKIPLEPVLLWPEFHKLTEKLTLDLLSLCGTSLKGARWHSKYVSSGW